MSFANANSDRDAFEQRWGASRGIPRTCAECHREFWMARNEDYVTYPLCDACCTVRDEDARRAKEIQRMTRDEHLAWCKTRARAYLPSDPAQAATSMMSDLRKHPETAELAASPAISALFLVALTSARAARQFIDGFN